MTGRARSILRRRNIISGLSGFLFFYKQGLAYQKAPVNWCDVCQAIAANDQVIDGKCERTKNPVCKDDVAMVFKVTVRIVFYKISTFDWPSRLRTCSGIGLVGAKGVLNSPLICHPRTDVRRYLGSPSEGPTSVHRLYHPSRHPLRRNLCRACAGASTCSRLIPVNKDVDVAR